MRYAEPDYARIRAAAPDDPYLRSMWGLKGTGGGIDAARAWSLVGGRGTTVAVVDSGIDLEHPDLEANVWRNPGESGQWRELNHVDDDGNGLVDDWRGWDWVEDDNRPSDENGHGTHVAGTIAARGNNRRGIAGVAWQGTVLPLRVLDDDATGSVSDLISAYRYADEKGIAVVNASVNESSFSRAERDAIAAAEDTLFVVAAGNEATNVDWAPSYPCDYELANVVCVAAVGRSGKLAEFSNYGARSVDLAAPGTGIVSTWPGGEWRSRSGTSMAAPHVSGVAALVSALRRRSGASLRQALVDGAVPAPRLDGAAVAAGSLNAYRPVLAAMRASGRVLPRRLRVRVSLRSPQRRANVMRRGVRVRAGCTRACALQIELSRPARNRGHPRSSQRRWVDAGRGKATLARAGRLSLVVKLHGRTKRSLRRMPPARLVVRVVAIDEDRRRSVLVRRLKLKG